MAGMDYKELGRYFLARGEGRDEDEALEESGAREMVVVEVGALKEMMQMVMSSSLVAKKVMDRFMEGFDAERRGEADYETRRKYIQDWMKFLKLEEGRSEKEVVDVSEVESSLHEMDSKELLEFLSK